MEIAITIIMAGQKNLANLLPEDRYLGPGGDRKAIALQLYQGVRHLPLICPHIRVNALAPGFFVARQNRALLLNKDGSLTDRGRQIIDHTPMGRFGEPEELLGATLWLLSPASQFVTGIVLPVDGGFSAFSGV